MKRAISKILSVATMCGMFIMPSLSVNAALKPAEPVILDIDMCGDVDDIMAIRLAENYDKLGKIDLLAVTSNVKGNEDAIAGMLTKEGFGSVPVGISPYSTDDTIPNYWAKFSETPSKNEKKDAVKLMRKILAESSEPVSIITTGYMTNVYGLMISAGDEISPLNGMELIKKKVKEVHVTGGVFPTGIDNNFAYVPNASISAQYVFEKWNPAVPMIIYTYNLGGSLMCGGNLQAVADTDYLAWSLRDRGVPGGSSSWDAFTVFVFANLGDSKAHGIQYKKCNMEVQQDGTDTMTDAKDGKFYRIIKTKEDNYYKNQINAELVVR